MAEKEKKEIFNEGFMNQYKFLLDMYNDDARKQEFMNTYGQEGVDMLMETGRRVNNYTKEKAVQGEDAATEAFSNLMVRNFENPANQDSVTGKRVKETNPFKQLGKGGAKGAALMWNGVIDIGRGLFDPENHAKLTDKVFNRIDALRPTEKERGAFERYFEDLKRSAVRGERGFMSNWMRGVMEGEEWESYGETAEQKAMKDAPSWLKFDDIPYAKEDLGLIGKIGEIAAQEIVTIGPFALMKLKRASKVAKYFADKAGAPVAKGKFISEGADKGKYISAKVGTELKGGDYDEYIKSYYKYNKKEQMKMQRLLDVYNAEGRWIKRAPFMRGGGAYLEAELVTSGMVITGGVAATAYFGEDKSIFGEIGGGIAGPTIAARVGRYGLDWVNFMMYKLPGDQDKKLMRALRSLGFDDAQIGKMNPELQQKYLDAVTSTPSMGGIYGFFDFSSTDRKRLLAVREWNKKFNALPDSLRDPLMEKTAEIKRIMGKFDDGSGKIYVTIDRAFDMAWLQSLRTISRSRTKLGKTVTAKFDEQDMELARREIQNAQELNRLLGELATSRFRGDGAFDVLMQSLRGQLDETVTRLEKDKQEIGILAKDLRKSMVKHFRPDLEHVYKYVDAKAYYIDEAGKLQRRVEGDASAIRFNRETGKYEPVMDKTTGKPVKLEDTPENLMTQSDLDKMMSERFLDDIDAERYAELVDNAGAFWHPVYDESGKIIKRQLAFRDLIPDADHAKAVDEGSYKLLNLQRRAKQEADDAYGNIKGLEVSAARATDANPSALSDLDTNRMTALIGRDLLDITKVSPKTDITQIAKGLKSIGKTEDNMISYFAGKRFEGLQSARTRLGDKEFARLLEQIIKNNPDLLKQFNTASIKPFKTLSGGRVDIDADGIDTWIEVLANKIDIELPHDSIRLDVSLGDLKNIRTDLYSTMNRAFDTADKKMVGHFHKKMANSITKQFDTIDNLKSANQKYSDYSRQWMEGSGQKLYSTLYDHTNKNFDDIFDTFVDVTGRGARGAREDFDDIALQIDPMSGEKVYSPILKKNLQLAVEKRIRNKQRVHPDFYREFGDLLNFESATEGYDGLIDLAEIGSVKYAGKSAKQGDLHMQLADIMNRPLGKAKNFETKLLRVAEQSYEKFGISLKKMQDIVEKNVGDEIGFRKEILKDTYAGGDGTRVMALAEHIDDMTDIAAKTQAQKGLQRLLLNGAMEEAFRLRRIKGIDFEPIRVKKSVAEDGTELLETAGGNFKQTMEMDSSALGIYIQRNEKILAKVLGPEQFDDLKDVNSLASLVIGDLPNQAIENMPKEMRWQSIMSRVYNVVRGVVSPRYVITELLIQDARYRKGRLLMEMASDPESFGMLSEVILRNGLENKQIRTEFIDWFKQGLIRGVREGVEEETAFVEEDVHGLSDTIWNKSGSSDGLDHLRYPGEIGG